jgi:hypothetical protein
MKNNYIMIYLKHNKVNLVPLTLNENLLISPNPVFVFEFIREWDNEVFRYVYNDVSNASNIFNLFEIELSDSATDIQSVVNGPVNMRPGQYLYKIWDNYQDSYVLNGYVLNGYFEGISVENLLEKGMLIVEKKEIGSINQNPQNIYN